MRLRKFFIGFIAALFIPAIKHTQSMGAASAFSADIAYWLGVGIPFIGMGILMGIYALTVEADEVDMQRLFRTCLAMPAFVLTLASGGGDYDGKAIAAPVELTCQSHHPVMQGLTDSINKMRGKDEPRYMLLSKELKGENVYVQAKDGSKLWVVGPRHHMLEGEVFLDMHTCEILEPKPLP